MVLLRKAVFLIKNSQERYPILGEAAPKATYTPYPPALTLNLWLPECGIKAGPEMDDPSQQEDPEDTRENEEENGG